MQKAKAKLPTLKEEQKLWQRGYAFVVGLDEAGRGPLAGPVVACAFCFCAQKQKAQAKLKIKNEKLKISGKIKDSKQLSPRQREIWYKFLTNHPDIKWGIGIVSEKIIDRINILQATKLAMKKAIDRLKKDLNDSDRISCDRKIYDWDLKRNKIDFLIVDGNFKIDLPIPQKSIIKADEKNFSCAAASIIAKVTRDRIMVKYHKKYPRYGFDRHKGYGTKAHFRAIEIHGPCRIHRLSFTPFSQDGYKAMGKFKFVGVKI